MTQKKTTGITMRPIMLSLCCLLSFTLSLQAGGGPESVFVVVNADDADSLQIANTYIALRRIPAINTLYLKDIPHGPRISHEDFRNKILKPILLTLQQRKLQQHIDYITYSSGFPFQASFDDTFARKSPYIHNNIASLTGMTYPYSLSLTDKNNFLGQHEKQSAI